MSNQPVTLEREKKVFPSIIMYAGFLIFLLIFILRLNLMCLIAVAYTILVSFIMLIGVLSRKKVYERMVIGYTAALIGVILYYIIFGADGGFGAFSTGLRGFKTAEHPILQGPGNFFTRLLGNLLLALPSGILLWGLWFTAKNRSTEKKNGKTNKALSVVLSILLFLTSAFYVLTMNLRSKPNTKRMWEGEKEYLDNVDRKATRKNSPNVLFILMDDLGYGDISLNGSIYETPNIDSIGENGINCENFYSSYSVCSPARFAAFTGRYPYRGYADNVIYPTVNTFSPLAATRVFNSAELGGNADGMLGDEITMAETFKAAGYDTGIFGKWHLGDYGEYLPTNQGFDYFYGSHYVNDMNPFYHVREENGQYEIVRGTDELKDQSKATEWINKEMFAWIDKQSESDKPFFLCYTSPWPHAPVYVGDDFKGKSGMGTYVDCVKEVDHYLGLLFKKLEEKGELENTIIVFTSDNGPALEGSTKNLRGGKYLAYEGGQKVPFLIRWDDADGRLGKTGTVREGTATLVDLYPTLVELCGITGHNGKNVNYLPEDREIDGVSMTPLLKDDNVIHGKDSPILHMKREKVKGIQYTVPTSEVLKKHPDYRYPVLTGNDYVTFKYFKHIQNDNSAFFNMFRNNWLHILNDDEGENYNREPVYPDIAEEYREKMEKVERHFRENRRGIRENSKKTDR